MKQIGILIGFLLAISCGSIDRSASKVYIGGEIVNPTSDYLVLFKDDKVIDSAQLDHNNRFNIKFKDLEEIRNYVQDTEGAIESERQRI